MPPASTCREIYYGELTPPKKGGDAKLFLGSLELHLICSLLLRSLEKQKYRRRCTLEGQFLIFLMLDVDSTGKEKKDSEFHFISYKMKTDILIQL